MGWNFLKWENDDNYMNDPIKECLIPRQNSKSTLLKKEIMGIYGYGDASEEAYDPTYCNPTWLGLITEKCNIHGIVEKARYVIYFFTETDMNVDTLKEEEDKLNKLNGQEFIDEVNNIAKTVQSCLMFKEDSSEEVDNED